MSLLNHYQKDGCKLCGWVKAASQGGLSSILWETPYAVAVAGEHQYFEGYAMIISKIHVREMYDLPAETSAKIFQDVLDLGKAIASAYKPWKINYASFGNVEEHLHWHVIPRYESDPDHKDHPWKNAGEFAKFKTTATQVQTLNERLSAHRPKV